MENYDFKGGIEVLQVGDWVTQYSVGYWQVVDIKAKYAEEDGDYGKQFWKKGEQIGKWVFLKKAFTPKMKLQIRCECVDEEWCKTVSIERKNEIEKYFKEHPKDWKRFLSAPVVIKPTIEPIWLNLSNEEAIKLEKLLTELPKPFTANMLRKLFDQNSIQVTLPPTSHILYLFCNLWEMDEKYNLLYFAAELNEIRGNQEP